mgnify:FL=1
MSSANCRERLEGESNRMHLQQQLFAEPIEVDASAGEWKGENGQLQLFQTLWDDIESHVGSYTYGQLHIQRHSGEEVNVVFDGRYACAYFLTARLYHFHLLETWDGWVVNLPTLLAGGGWRQLPRVYWENQYIPHLSVIIYQPFNGTPHTGFYMKDSQVISTARHEDDPEDKRAVRRHHWLYEGREVFGDGPREVESIWLHPLLHGEKWSDFFP